MTKLHFLLVIMKQTKRGSNMKDIVFYARNKITGENFTFTFNDLYGYEGEDEGVFIQYNKTKINLPQSAVNAGFNKDYYNYSSIALNYNSGSVFKGINPDLDIYDVKITEK